MVEISPEVAINALIRQGVMIKIEGNILFNNPKSHCVILLNHTPLNDDYLVFACASSQYIKRLEEANKRGLPASTIVMIKPGVYHHLPKYTAVDCNYLYTLTKGEFTNLYSQNRVVFYKNNSVVSKVHLSQLIVGVVDSPLVIDEIKNIVKAVD